jgi:hypothetical protein
MSAPGTILHYNFCVCNQKVQGFAEVNSLRFFVIYWPPDFKHPVLARVFGKADCIIVRGPREKDRTGVFQFLIDGGNKTYAGPRRRQK